MNLSLKNVLKGLSLVVAVALGNANAQAGVANLAVYNTGSTTKFDAAPVLLPAFAHDTHYKLTPPPATVLPATAPIAFVNLGNQNYAPPTGSALWIGPGPTLGNQYNAGTYTYETTFTLSQGSSGTLAGITGSDDQVLSISINGVVVPGTSPLTSVPGSVKAWSWSGLLIAGINKIDFAIANKKGNTPTGKTATAFYNEFTTATYAVPEPSTFALLGLGAIGMGVASLRRRRAAAV